MQNIIGISLGTRLMGLAVVYHGELTDFRVRTFYGAWNNDKRAEMIKTIEQSITRYGITKIVVKTPKPSHCSPSITDLTNDILALGEKHGIRVMVCTISMILRNQQERTLKNKKSLMQSIVGRYPNQKKLAQLCAKERTNHAPYYVKLFEAIACTEM